MSKQKNCKRVLSIVLVIALSVGAITISGPGRVKANSSTTVIAEDFETAEGWINNSDPFNPEEVGEQKVSSAQVPNYITEQHFEEAAEYNGRWRNQSPGRGTMDYVEDGENHVLKYTSASAEAATFDFNNGDNQIFEKGKTYTLSYKYKSTVSFHAYHAGLSSAWDTYRAWVSPSDTWTTVTQQITPNDSLSSFQIGFQILGQGEFYLDDFVISCGTKDKVTEMVHSVLDLDFEEEAELDCFKEGAAAGTLTTEEKKDGARSFKMTTSSSWTFVVFGTFLLEKGKEYTISYDWKVPAITGGDAQFAYSRMVNRDKGLYADQGAVLKQSDFLQTPTEWAKVTYTYTPTEDIANAAFIMELGGVGNIYIDNLSVSYTTTETEATYSEGIGNCGGAEPDNVLVMENMTEVTHAAAITAGTTYEYSFDMKNDATGSDFAFGFGAGDNEIWNAASGEQAASGWTTISGKYTASSDADSIKFIRAGAGKVYLDNILLQLEESAAETNPEVTLSLDKVDIDNSWYLNASDLSQATETFYKVEATIDGTVHEVVLEKQGNKFVIWPSFFGVYGGSVPSESLKIAKDAVIAPVTSAGWNVVEGTKLTVKQELTVTKKASGWMEGDEQEEKEPIIVSLGEAMGIYNKGDTPNEVFSVKISEPQEMKTRNITVKGILNADGAERESVVFFPGIGECFFYLNGASDTLMISKDTEFTAADGTVIRFDKNYEVDLVNGLIFEQGNKPAEKEAKELQLTFDRMIKDSFMFAYKLSESTKPESGFYRADAVVDGRETQVLLEYYANDDAFFIYPNCFHATPVDGKEGYPTRKLEFKKGTTLTPVVVGSWTLNVTGQPYKLTAGLDITYHDSTWMETEKLNAISALDPLEVRIVFRKVQGRTLLLGVITPDGKEISDIYGDWTYGQSVLKAGEKNPSTGQMTYTTKRGPFCITGDRFWLDGFEIYNLDAVQIDAGTVIYPDKICNSIRPIKIMNNLRIVRDDLDEWVLDASFSEVWEEKENTPSGNSGSESASGVAEEPENKKQEIKRNENDRKLSNIVFNANRETEKKTMKEESGVSGFVIGLIAAAAAVVAGAVTGGIVIAGKHRKRRKAEEE